MNSPSAAMRCLLDKNVIRYAITGLHCDHLRPLSPLETGALSFWRAAEERGVVLFISHVSFQVLRRLDRYDKVRVLLDTTSVLSPTRYHARWARRIRETTGLTREDAAIIALTSFGSDQQGSILGTHLLITYDRPMINGYLDHFPELQRRLGAMTAQLPAPFHQVALPRMRTPDEILTEWTG